MPRIKIKNQDHREGRLLLIYNLYRILSVFLFLGFHYYTPASIVYSVLFYCILTVYFVCILIFIGCSYLQILRFERLVLLSGTLDIIALSVMLALIGNLGSGQGVLLNFTIAALSILVPGRLAVYFAALASCLVLCDNLVEYFVYNQKDLGPFYYSGIYGAGFFATALTAWYLSNRVRLSEHLAQRRSDELQGMQRINEYIVGRMSSGIVYVDEHKDIILINAAAREFFGLRKASHISALKHISPVLSEEFDRFVTKVGGKEGIAQVTIEEPFLKLHFFSIVVAEKPAVLISIDDMTYIAQQAQQLKLAALGRFSASIAHELRNPLGAIAHAGQLLGENEHLNSEDKRLKDLIISNCDRMNGVIKNVLQLSRRETSQPAINELPLFLEHFKHHFCLSNSCEFIIKVPKKTLNMVFDKSQLEQIMVILCDNILKHGRDETGVARIEISAKSKSGSVSLIVSDSGPGVPKEHQDSIFEPFFTTLRNGTGMGLFIARDLCEINQARLALMNVKKGCSFSITQNASDDLLL
jgi:two-component system sensor histidine kinase PilS (NtrC family)